MGLIESGFKGTAKASGNFAKGDFRSIGMKFQAGPLENSILKGEIDAFGKEGFNFKNEIRLNLKKAFKYLPNDIIQSLGLKNLKGNLDLTLKTEGSLDESFQPGSTESVIKMSMTDFSTEIEKASIKNLNLKSGMNIRCLLYTSPSPRD